MLAAILYADWKPRKGYVPSKIEIETKKVSIGSRIWNNPNLKIEEIDIPKISSIEVLIKVKACGICGSDIHMYEKDNEGYMLYPGLTKLPVVIGHELSGEVVKVGEKVKELKEGDMVTAEEMWWCGYCTPCRKGYVNQCENLEEMGFTVQGGFAEYIAIDAKYCWKINDLLNIYNSEDKVYEAGSLVEPTSVAYNAIFVRAGGFNPGGYIVVYGAGPIGLASIALAKASGAGKVIAFETSEERAKLAKEMGADYVFNPVKLEKENIHPYEKVLEVTNGMGADLQIEAAGAPLKTLPEMQKCLAIGGKITWIGRADVEAPIFMENFQVRAAQIYGSQGHSGYGTFMNVIRLMASGKIDMTKIITRRYKLSNILEAMEQAKKRVDAKITIKP